MAPDAQLSSAGAGDPQQPPDWCNASSGEFQHSSLHRQQQLIQVPSN